MDSSNVLIWKSAFPGEYAGVRSALELAGIPVTMRNELTNTVLSVEATSGAELWIPKERYAEALDVLYDASLISRLAYNEAKGLPQHPDDTQALEQAQVFYKTRRFRLIVIIVGILMMVLAYGMKG